MHILVLTTRNLYENSGEYNLMSAKDRALKGEGVDTIYYSFRRSFPFKTAQNLNIVKQESTYAILFNKRKIIANIVQLIEEYGVKIIVISGGWLHVLYRELLEIRDEYKLSFSFDYQGAIEELVEYRVVKNSLTLSKILYTILHHYEKIMINLSDGVEVVSANSLKHIKKLYKTPKEQKFVIISCGIEYPLSAQNYKKYRALWRKKYDLKEHDIACVYAGGIAKWQNIDEIIKKAKESSAVKLYIYTSIKNQEIIKEKYELGDNVYFDYLSHEELAEALSAFDYGFLLRNEDITNYVAFPNKYADYINARLQVVVKNTKIGYYPESPQRQMLIQNVEEELEIREDRDEELYDAYIKELSYSSMIKDLLDYYNELIKKDKI